MTKGVKLACRQIGNVTMPNQKYIWIVRRARRRMCSFYSVAHSLLPENQKERTKTKITKHKWNCQMMQELTHTHKAQKRPSMGSVFVYCSKAHHNIQLGTNSTLFAQIHRFRFHTIYNQMIVSDGIESRWLTLPIRNIRTSKFHNENWDLLLPIRPAGISHMDIFLNRHSLQSCWFFIIFRFSSVVTH